MNAPFRTHWDVPVLEGAVGGQAYGRDFTITLPKAPWFVDPRVVAFRGTEALNELYTFHILTSVERTAVEPDIAALLGTRVLMTLPEPPEPHLVHGIIASADLVTSSYDRAVYSLEVVPALWLLGKTKNSRVYQEMTVEEIVDEVLTRHRIPHLFSIAGQYQKREYCLQYAESDLAFVERLLREEGFVTLFDHLPHLEAASRLGFEEATECWVIGDNRAMYSPVTGSPLLVYKPEGRSAIAGGVDDVHRFSPHASIEVNLETLRDFEFELATAVAGLQNPSGPTTQPTAIVLGGTKTTVLKFDQPSDIETLEVYDHDVEEPRRRGVHQLAKVRLEQQRRGAKSFAGSAYVRRLLPGRTFRLLDHPFHDAKDEVVLTRVEHRGHDLGGTKEPRYVNDFDAVPSSVLFRAPAPARRLVQVVESAVVVGPAGQEIETDGYGRVRVQFHWDRLQKNDESSSCWLRVVQAWSGPNYGFQFVPRVGSEVLVSFLGGNPDHPVITGCLPSTFDTLPHLLPQDKTRSAIRSRTTPAVTGGYNEIMFDDAAGNEVFAMRAERDLEENILNDKRVSVGNRFELEIGADRHIKVGGAETLKISAHAQRSVGGNSVDIVVGGSIASIGGDLSARIDGNHTLSVGHSSTVKVAGPQTTIIGEGEETEALTSVFGEHRLSGSKLLELRSSTKIRFAVGTSLVEIHPDHIHIEADRIETFVKGEQVTNADVVRIATKTKVEIDSKEQKLTSSGASLVLDGDAHLDGGKVLLNCMAGKGKPPDEAEERKKGEVSFTIEPPAGMKGPFTVLVSTPDGEVIEKQTDGSNQITLEGEEGGKFTVVDVLKDGQSLHKPAKA